MSDELIETEELTLYEAILRGYSYCTHTDSAMIGATLRMRSVFGDDVVYITLRDQIEVEWAKRGLL